MTEEKHDFRLNADEWKYLTQLMSRDEKLAHLLERDEDTRGPGATVRLSRIDAEQLRDYLTTQLASAGFDENYAPNKEGEMLEKLINKFYIS